MRACRSLPRIAAWHVLRRHSAPRHSPEALCSFKTLSLSTRTPSPHPDKREEVLGIGCWVLGRRRRDVIPTFYHLLSPLLCAGRQLRTIHSFVCEIDSMHCRYSFTHAIHTAHSLSVFCCKSSGA